MEIEEKLRAAERYEYRAVLLPLGFVSSSLTTAILGLLEKYRLRPVFQIDSKSLRRREMRASVLALPGRGWVNVHLADWSESDFEWLAALDQKFERVWLTVVGEKRRDLVGLLRRLPETVLERLYFYFPYSHSRKDGFYSGNEIHTLLQKIKLQTRLTRFHPPPGQELFDSQAPADRERHPVIDPRVVYRTARSRIGISVVIPTYNNRMYVQNVIRHLLRQDLDRERFQIIVVDDGSNDGTIEALEAVLVNQRTQVNYKYIYFPRTVDRGLGDDQFRAGVARNLGVSHADGDLLVFLDSDVLVPENFLSDLLIQHETADLIQARRRDLRKYLSSHRTEYKQISPSRHVCASRDHDWERFQQAGNWQDADVSWKYVSAFCLSVKTSDFKKAGWFRTNYVSYGFEDTDLGYRMVKNGVRLLLNDLDVYHLHPQDRSEYGNSQFRKNRLLARTAAIFYRHTLDDQVFAQYRLQLGRILLPKLIVHEIANSQIYFKGLFPAYRALHQAFTFVRWRVLGQFYYRFVVGFLYHKVISELVRDVIRPWWLERARPFYFHRVRPQVTRVSGFMRRHLEPIRHRLEAMAPAVALRGRIAKRLQIVWDRESLSESLKKTLRRMRTGGLELKARLQRVEVGERWKRMRRPRIRPSLPLSSAKVEHPPTPASAVERAPLIRGASPIPPEPPLFERDRPAPESSTEN